MDVYLYNQHKSWILEDAYIFYVDSVEQRGSSTLRDHINYICFDRLQNAGETIDELYAACYYMWFYLYHLHNIPLNSDRLGIIEKVICYLEGGIEFQAEFQKECLEEDICQLRIIKKQLVDEKKKKGMDFEVEMRIMDKKLRLDGIPTYQRYGKSNDSVNWPVAKTILLGNSSNEEKFLCLATYCKICMYEEIKICDEAKEILKEFLISINEEEIVANFTTTDEIDVKDYIVFLRRSVEIKPLMSKDEFLNILVQKGIPYNAGNYVDRIEIGNIHISLNTISGHDTRIPFWDVKLKYKGHYYTIAKFDNSTDAYKYFLEKLL